MGDGDDSVMKTNLTVQGFFGVIELIFAQTCLVCVKKMQEMHGVP